MANRIDLAEQQLLGFKHRQSGGDLRSLVMAMGLTAEEWIALKKNYSLAYLSEDDILDVEDYLDENK